jgi:DNA-binding transcriptional LysR family regulator
MMSLIEFLFEVSALFCVTRHSCRNTKLLPNTLFLAQRCFQGMANTDMELRHLRYFARVAETLNFTKAATALRVAQPALSRQIQDLEDEIGVDLLTRGPRGVTLTAEGKLFLSEVQSILSATDSAVEKVRALARGEYGTLHVGYAPTPSTEVLPKALATFRARVPRVTVKLHDLSGDEMAVGLRDGTLEIALMVRPLEENITGLIFEPLLSYPMMVACSHDHPFKKLRRVSVKQLRDQKLIVLRRDDYSDYHHLLSQIFAQETKLPAIAAECDSASSLITELEGGHGVAILSKVMKSSIGSRLIMRPLHGTEVDIDVGLCRAMKGDVTPAGEKFCEFVRQAAREV